MTVVMSKWLSLGTKGADVSHDHNEMILDSIDGIYICEQREKKCYSILLLVGKTGCWPNNLDPAFGCGPL